jgi:hypothetical protein
VSARGPFLLLNRRPLLDELAHWFPDAADALVVITTRVSLEGRAPEAAVRRFRHLEILDEYESPHVETHARRLHAQHGFTRILGNSETDVVRAACLRQELGIEGQGLASAIAYRDKYVMKSIASSAGVVVTPMRIVGDGDALREFAAEVGYPLVLKPIDGAASVGMERVGDEDDLVRVGERLASAGALLAEAFVPGDMFHVDGLMRAGRVVHGWPSRYLYSQWETMYEARPNISGTLGPEHPLVPKLLDATAATIAALPPTANLCAFHAELFNPRGDEIVLCEIACRPGGGGIVEAYRRTFGVDLHEAALLGQAGRLEAAEQLYEGPAGTRYGWAFFPPRVGVLLDAPTQCPLPNVVRFDGRGTKGRAYPGPGFVTDRIADAAFVVTEPDPRSQLQEIVDWYEASVTWSTR